jgi:hypothetical protein
MTDTSKSNEQPLNAAPERQYSVAQRPLRNLPAERRAAIAQEALQAYETGIEIADIAPDYGISDVTLYALLIRDHEEQWKQAQRGRALARKSRAYKDLDELRAQLRSAMQENEDGTRTPHDVLSLARIREQIRLAEVQCKRAEWELERVYRRIYGQDAQTDNAGRIAITLNIGGGNTTVAAQHDVEGTVLASTIAKE